MVTFRNAVAIVLFLFGASYLWLTPTFLEQSGFRGTIFDPKGLLAMLGLMLWRRTDYTQHVHAHMAMAETGTSPSRPAVAP